MLDKRWITLPVVYQHPFASNMFFLRDFEGFWVRRLLLLIIEEQARNPCFERAPALEQFSPENRINPQKGQRIHTSSRTFLSKNSSKRSGGSPWRKLKSHSFWTVKMHSKTHTCQPETVPLIASFWRRCNERRLGKRLLFNNIQSKRGNQWDSFWLAPMNLATHFDHSKLWGFNFLQGLTLDFFDGFSIGRYKQKCKSFDLIDAKFESKVMQFSKGKLLQRWSPFKTRIPPLSFYY